MELAGFVHSQHPDGRRLSAEGPHGVDSSVSSFRILIANPNATQSMTINCVKMVDPTLPPDVTVTGFTAPTPAPSAVEGIVDSVMSSAAAMRAILPLQSRERFSAILVACYSDHPLIRMLREELDIPIIGIMEASLFAARTLGARFGIVATGRRSKTMHRDAVRHYGLDAFCAGVEACDLGVLDLEKLPREQILRAMCGAAVRLMDQGADVLTLGCAGMSDMKAAVEAVAAERGVQVVDGVLAGVHHLIGIVRIGGSTAKSGLYASSARARMARGQEYL